MNSAAPPRWPVCRPPCSRSRLRVWGIPPGASWTAAVAGGGSCWVSRSAGGAAQTLAGYFLAVIVFSAGVGIGMLTRAAVADMYPAEHRAGAVGLVITGGLVGGIGGPLLVAVGDYIARAAGGNPLAVPSGFSSLAFGA